MSLFSMKSGHAIAIIGATLLIIFIIAGLTNLFLRNQVSYLQPNSEKIERNYNAGFTAGKLEVISDLGRAQERVEVYRELFYTSNAGWQRCLIGGE